MAEGRLEDMTIEEKTKKFDEIQQALWHSVTAGNLTQSIFAKTLIEQFQIEGPNGEKPGE